MPIGQVIASALGQCPRPSLVALILLCTQAAAQTQAEWTAAATRAAQAHEAEDDATAVALLQELIPSGIALFGPESPRLILPLRMLSASLANLHRPTDSTTAALQATRIARGLGKPDDLLSTLSDLARARLVAGDTATAALLAAEMVIQDTADDGTAGPYATEGAALWALSLRRAGHPDEALARLLPALRLPPESLPDDTPDLIALFDSEAGVTDQAAVKAWTTRVLSAESDRAAADQTLLEALDPVYAALQRGDAHAADRAGRTALATVSLDDPLVTAA